MTVDKEIKAALKEKKVLLGSRSVLKAARMDRLSSLIYAKNIPKETMSDMRHYANITEISPQEFPGNSLELGELCGKPFGVLLIGISK